MSLHERKSMTTFEAKIQTKQVNYRFRRARQLKKQKQ